jgi:outer membrane protein insertion porin family
MKVSLLRYSVGTIYHPGIMKANQRLRRISTFIIGMLLAQGVGAWSQSPEPADTKKIIESIRFEGIKNLDAGKMRSKLVLKEKAVFDASLVDADAETIERSLRDQGYVYARIDKVRGDVIKPDRIVLIFAINSGEVYYVSEIKVIGNHAFSAKQITPSTHVVVGQLFCGSAIKEEEKMIQDFYGERGYADVRLEISIWEVAKDKVRLQYDIKEGVKSRLQGVKISGNTKVKEDVIRKEFKLAPGDVFNTVLIEQGRQALLKTGLFESVGAEGTAVVKQGFKDLTITVVEK